MADYASANPPHDLPDSTFKQPTAFPRRAFARVLRFRCPSEPQRAQGKPGADCARRSRALEHTGIPCAKHMGKDYRYSRDIPAFPTQWLYDLLRALPGEPRFLSPLSAGYPPAK